MPNEYEVAWNLFTELRKETLETQKIRAQVIGFKITFVSAGIGLIAANKLPGLLFVVPAIAAVFFDLLIASYSFSIKRIAYYCRTHIEKRIRGVCVLPDEFPLWHEFLLQKWTEQRLSRYGNIGLTFLAMVPATIALFQTFSLPIFSLALVLLVGLFASDVRAQRLALRVADGRAALQKDP
jgi:hypothetical protein